MGHLVSTGPKHALKPEGAPISSLDQLDPRARILATIVFVVVTISISSIWVLALCLLTSFGLLLISRQQLRPTLRRMVAMDGFIIFMLILLPFTVPGQSLFFVFGFGFSFEGLLKAVEIGLKANASVLALLVLVRTMEPVMFGHALHRLKIPENLVNLLMFTLRYIGVLYEEYIRLREAMKMRGFRSTNSLHTYRSIGYLVGMMLIRSIDRSERILSAMKCRGFDGKIHMLSSMQFTIIDAVFVSTGLLLLVAYKYLDLFL
jgi:cobalt/nickel transport system permease protein